MRAMGGRPVLMQRFPKGVGGPTFFQKRVPDGAPEWLETTTVQTVNGTPSRALVAADVGARRVGGQPRLPRLPRLAQPRRRPRARRRAAPRPRPAARHRLRAGARRRLGAEGAARRARHRRLPEDDWQPRAARLRPAAAAVGSLRGPRRGGRRRARARAPPPGHPHRRLVEGGARRADLRRLQPERAAQDRLRRLVGALARGRAGLDPVAWEELDEIDPDALTVATVPGRVERDGDPWAAIDAAPQSLDPLLELHERDRENGLPDAPWPPVYPKQPGELRRVAPSRARKDG